MKRVARYGLHVFAALLAPLVACNGSTGIYRTPDAGEPRCPTPRDAGPLRSFTKDAGSGPVYDWVITSITVDAPAYGPRTRGVHGFDLDGRHSPFVFAEQQDVDCQHGDDFSTLDPDQNLGTCVEGASGGGPQCRGGVDNQLPVIVDQRADINRREYRTEVRERIASGALTYLLRVEGLDAPPGTVADDAFVRVSVYPVAWPMFGDCSLLGAPGLTYQVDDASLSRAGDLTSARVAYVGRIERGRLIVDARTAEVEGQLFPFPLIAGDGALFRDDLHGSRFRVSFVDELHARDGNLGGWLYAARLTEMFTGGVLGDDSPYLPGLLDGSLDIPVGPCDRWLRCYPGESGISVGVGFEMVRAVISPTTTAGRPAGTCAP